MSNRFDRRGLSGPRRNKGHVNGGGMLAAYHHPESLTWRWCLSWSWRFEWRHPRKWVMWHQWLNPGGTGSRSLCIGPFSILYTWQEHHWRTPEMDLRSLVEFPKGWPRKMGPEGPVRVIKTEGQD